MRYTKRQVLTGLTVFLWLKALAVGAVAAFIAPRGSNFELAMMLAMIITVGAAAAASVILMIHHYLLPISAAYQMGFREATRQHAKRREHLRAVRDDVG